MANFPQEVFFSSEPLILRGCHLRWSFLCAEVASECGPSLHRRAVEHTASPCDDAWERPSCEGLLSKTADTKKSKNAFHFFLLIVSINMNKYARQYRHPLLTQTQYVFVRMDNEYQQRLRLCLSK